MSGWASHGASRSAAIAALTGALLPACWKAQYAEVPPDVLQFHPEINGDAGGPPGWLVSPIEVPLQCPDGEPAHFYVVYPEHAGDAPLPAAVLYHSGAFDFVYAPTPGDALAGTHYADPGRLDSAWAVHQVFVTLGMYPEQDGTEVHDGRLPAALAEAGIPFLMPANCWGDLWANKSGAADNDFGLDLFSRQGRTAAEWGWQFLVDPGFAALFEVELPFVADPDRSVAIGLGEGGRAVAELLSIDNDLDGTPDYAVPAAVVDSPPDDLRVYFADAGLFASTVQGLERVFPGGPESTASGSIWAATLPSQFAYFYSTEDPRLPSSINSAALARLAGLAGAWVDASEDIRHLRLNGGAEPELPGQVVSWLSTGQTPDQR